MSSSFATPWTVPTRLLCLWLSQARLGKTGLGAISFPGDLRDSGIKLESPALAGRFFPTGSPGKPSLFAASEHPWGCPQWGLRGCSQEWKSSHLGSEGPGTRQASRFGTSSHDTVFNKPVIHLKCRVMSPERFTVTTFLYQLRYSRDNSECNKFC